MPVGEGVLAVAELTLATDSYRYAYGSQLPVWATHTHQKKYNLNGCAALLPNVQWVLSSWPWSKHFKVQNKFWTDLPTLSSSRYSKTLEDALLITKDGFGKTFRRSASKSVGQLQRKQAITNMWVISKRSFESPCLLPPERPETRIVWCGLWS